MFSYSKILSALIAATVISLNPAYSFKSLYSDDLRGDYDQAHFVKKLNEFGIINEEIVSEWLSKTNIFDEEEKKGLTVTCKGRNGGNWAEQIIFVKTKTKEWVVKTWPDDVMTGINQRVRFTAVVSKAPYLQDFNNNPDFPFLTADIWSGTYKDQYGISHGVHLMPKAKGISLDEYMTEDLSQEHLIALFGRLGEVFGNAHAKTAIQIDEDPFKLESLFVAGNPHIENVFVSFDSEKPLISLIDLEKTGINVYPNNPYQYKLKPIPHDVGTLTYNIDLSTLIYKNNSSSRSMESEIEIVKEFGNSYAKAFGAHEMVVRMALVNYYLSMLKSDYCNNLSTQVGLSEDETSVGGDSCLFPIDRAMANIKLLTEALGVEYDFSTFDLTK